LLPPWEHARIPLVRIFSRSTVFLYAKAHAGSRPSFLAWFTLVRRSLWATPNDIKIRFPTASIIAGNRVVFNVGGNNYRVIVRVNYKTHDVHIRFIGTHAEYDKIDAETI
jgi:mRNA interferase HigB